MRTINIAVFFEEKLQNGGGYQQAINNIILIRKIPKYICSIIYVTTVFENIAVLRKLGIDSKFISIPKWRRMILKFRNAFNSPLFVKTSRCILGGNFFESYFERVNIDLIYFIAPSIYAQYLERLNYIFTVWDICYREELEFPEVRADRAFENREKLYKNTLTKAVAVIVESELGKKNVIRYYGVCEDRVYVIPFSPAKDTQVSKYFLKQHWVNIKQKYGFDIDYIFYPAQFWSHKNHIYILYAVSILEQKYKHKINVIFSGSDAGINMNYIRKITGVLGLTKRVFFTGFVSNEEIPYLYKQSLALVMPTYFGPTNLPPLEAFSLGVPVIYPNKDGLRDQVGNAALLMDLQDPNTLAKHLLSLIVDCNLKKELVQKGKILLKSMDNTNNMSNLIEIIKKFTMKRNCWE